MEHENRQNAAQTWQQAQGIRDRYVEYANETGTVSMIYDTENNDAWIRSNLTMTLTP